MSTGLIVYIIIINVLGCILMGIDKWKAVHGSWRIHEASLFLVAILGGSLGSLIGMYLFHHKTRKRRFSIGLPLLALFQLLLFSAVFTFYQGKIESPSAVVEEELSLVKQLDEETIQSFFSGESKSEHLPAPANPTPAAMEAAKLFFQDFSYQIESEEIHGNEATVIVQIKNIDTHTLSHDLCKMLTAETLHQKPNSQTDKENSDFFALLTSTLQSHSYAIKETDASFHLQRKRRTWNLLIDEALEDALVSGFVTWMNDPYILSAEEVLELNLQEFDTFTAKDWKEYLHIHDLFDTGSEAYCEQIDETYLEKTAEYFFCTIESCRTSGDSADAQLSVTSIDLPYILDDYREKLLAYSKTPEAITDDEKTVTDTSARLLLETLNERMRPAETSVQVHLTNDGHTWQLEISEELTDAFLGNLSQALEEFEAKEDE